MACKRSSVRLRYSPQALNRLRAILLIMSFYVYILYSASLNEFYVGHTGNMSDRLFRHRNSGSRSTKKTDDWVLKYKEEYPIRSEAMKREAAIKKMKSRKYIEGLISSAG